MSTRMKLDERWDATKQKPVYVDYFDQYLLWTIGRPSVDLAQVCVDQKPYGFQHHRSAEDGLIALFTIGIYTPTTVRVWCGER